MRRRLRKKLRLGEFRELGFGVRFELDVGPGSECRDSEGLDRFVEDWLEVVEVRGLQFGGGGGAVWNGVVANEGGGSTTAEDRACLAAWLDADPRVVGVELSPDFDVWHGDLDEWLEAES